MSRERLSTEDGTDNCINELSMKCWLSITVRNGDAEKTVEFDFPYDKNDPRQAFANAETFAKSIFGGISMDNVVKSDAKWIPTKKKLPEECGSYLITLQTKRNDLDVVEAEFYPSRNYSWGEEPARWSDPSGEYDYTPENVIAWAPMPEPYKKDK